MLVCASFIHFARETAGAARIRLSLRPLTTEGGTFPAKLARNARRDREAVFWTTPALKTLPGFFKIESVNVFMPQQETPRLAPRGLCLERRAA
jgi:hypothetical protein